MKTINFRGRRIEPHLVIGEDAKTGAFIVANDEPVSPHDICLFFMTIATLNKQTYEEFAANLVRGAKHLKENYPDLIEELKVL